MNPKLQNCARDQFEKGFNIASSGNVNKFLKKNHHASDSGSYNQGKK